MRSFGQRSAVLLSVIVVLIWLAQACGTSSSEPREYFYLSVGLNNDDLAEAAQQIGNYMRDFECLGGVLEDEKSGFLGCQADSSGFNCDLTERPAEVICAAGDEGSAPEDAFCTVVESPVSAGFFMRCYGPSGDTFCNIWRRGEDGLAEHEPAFGLACAPD